MMDESTRGQDEQQVAVVSGPGGAPDGFAPEAEVPGNLAILPSRDAVLYPGMLLPLQATQERLVRLLNDAASARQPVGLFLQRSAEIENPGAEDLYPIGTAASIVRMLRVPDGSLQVLLQGVARVSLGRTTQIEPYLRADVLALPAAAPPAEPTGSPEAMEREARVRNLQSLFGQVVRLSPTLPNELAVAAMNVDDPGRLADFVAANADLEPPQRQEILEEMDVLARVQRVTELLTRELEVLEIGSKIQTQIKESLDKSQREFYLRQQLQAIRKELGETDEQEATLADLRQRLEKAGLPEEVRKEADRELNRLTSIPTASPEHAMVRTYLEWLADLPWSTATEDRLDLRQAQRILDEDHHDLERVKDRILEFLAVMKLRLDAQRETAEAESSPTAGAAPSSSPPALPADVRESGTVPHPLGDGRGTVQRDTADTPTSPAVRAATMRGPILCLAGPPGVGKTSLGQSIARALGRKFVRMSLGGVRDEAEIRGHRRTYVGALPGRIIQGLRRAGSCNPVFILDEIDKLGADWRGDPSSALLEVLDPAQNHDFRDHYLDVPFDLSRVLFIATANVLDTIPAALRDRLEIIDIPGYTEDDKVEIARRYLIPRQLAENGLKPEQLKITEAALRQVIRHYTREAGVRNLEREIATIARKSARRVVLNETTDGAAVQITPRHLRELLGPQRFQQEVAERKDEVGVATGLAFTPVGGEVLFVEANLGPGKGNLILTGQLGDVMKESAQAALTYARTRAAALGLPDEDPLRDRDLHVHVPAGAVPKDGPSAGITMATAIVSALSRRPVDHTIGMTGEITLRGRVMPIGGLKEKVLAAHRAGLRRVIIPRDNLKDVDEIPARIRRAMTFVPVEHVDQVLNEALKREVREEKPTVKPARRPRGSTRREREPAAAQGAR